MSTVIALDTSVAVPLLLQSHREHRTVVEWWGGRTLTLCGHALAETYSVLTRLPGDVRLAPSDAARLLAERFHPPLLFGSDASANLPGILAKLDIAGGAVYDAMIALAALENGCVLATRDARAKATYDTVGAQVVMVG